MIFFKKTKTSNNTQKPIDVLINAPNVWNLTPMERKKLTISCRDTDYIKKVRNAGFVKKIQGHKVQIMHEGTVVSLGGYHGEWMTQIISELKGHHEPQEEKVFHEVMKRVEDNSWMIELGSFWAFYSIWFNRAVKGSKNLCCEPDPNNIKTGILNAKLNGVDINFIQAAAGHEDRKVVDIVMDSDNSKTVPVAIRSVDSLIEEYDIDKLEVLHIDVQGFEYDALMGCSQAIKEGKLRFVFVSTHHYIFSENPNIHQDCLDLIKKLNGHIIASHTIQESFSGDGLIVASFLEKDKMFKVDTSINHTDKALFRPYEKDIDILLKYIESNE